MNTYKDFISKTLKISALSIPIALGAVKAQDTSAVAEQADSAALAQDTSKVVEQVAEQAVPVELDSLGSDALDSLYQETIEAPEKVDTQDTSKVAEQAIPVELDSLFQETMEAPEKVDAQVKIHEVKERENLGGIAKHYEGLSWQDIAKLNNLQEPYTIFPGDKLVIKGELLEGEVAEQDTLLSLSEGISKFEEFYNDEFAKEVNIYNTLKAQRDSLFSATGDFKTTLDDRLGDIEKILDSLGLSLNKTKQQGIYTNTLDGLVQDIANNLTGFEVSLDSTLDTQMKSAADYSMGIEKAQNNYPKDVVFEMQSKKDEISNTIESYILLLERVKEDKELAKSVPIKSKTFPYFDFRYDPDEGLEESYERLKDIYLNSRESIKDEGLLKEFTSTYNEFLTGLQEFYSKKLNKFRSSKNIEEILNSGEFGDDVPELMGEYEKKVETFIENVGNLRAGKVEVPEAEVAVEDTVLVEPEEIFQREVTSIIYRGPEKEGAVEKVVPKAKEPKITKKHVKHKQYRKPTAIIGASFNYNPNEPSFYSGIFGLEFGRGNRISFEYGEGSKSSESSHEDPGEKDPYYGFHGHGYDDVEKDLELKRMALMFGKRLGRFSVDVGPVRYDEKTVSNHSVRNELHNANHDVLEYGDSYTRSDKKSSSKSGGSVGFGFNAYKNLDIGVGADFVKGHTPVYSAKASYKFGKKR